MGGNQRRREDRLFSFVGYPFQYAGAPSRYAVTRRAARVGFDWKKLEDVYEKLFEEIEELKRAQATDNAASVREEIGDLLFTIVNISRFLNIDPEDALRFSIDKFINRFSYIEKNTGHRNTSLETMDTLWNDIKDIEKKRE